MGTIDILDCNHKYGLNQRNLDLQLSKPKWSRCREASPWPVHPVPHCEETHGKEYHSRRRCKQLVAAQPVGRRDQAGAADRAAPSPTDRVDPHLLLLRDGRRSSWSGRVALELEKRWNAMHTDMRQNERTFWVLLFPSPLTKIYHHLACHLNSQINSKAFSVPLFPSHLTIQGRN